MSRTFDLECLRTLRPYRIACQHRSVFLQGRTAGGAIGDDFVDVVALEYSDIVPGLFFDKIHTAVAARGHAAAFDLLGRNHRASIAGENPQSRGTLFGKEKALRASEKEADPVALFSICFCCLRKNAAERALRNSWKHCLQVTDSIRQQAVYPQHVNEAADSKPLVEAQRPGCHFHAAGMRDQSSEEPILPFCRMSLLLNVAHRECQIGGMDSNGAGSLQAMHRKAAVHLLNEIGAEFKLSLETFAGESHTASW